ncbi:thiol-activated cytolysin family protein [Streptomyces arboris]|uniref:thiol-activated cytolysin family protein n=1 Tax=Streptomyces arboris TaxID=2600619 RepID=UPI0036449B15
MDKRSEASKKLTAEASMSQHAMPAKQDLTEYVAWAAKGSGGAWELRWPGREGADWYVVWRVGQAGSERAIVAEGESLEQLNGSVDFDNSYLGEHQVEAYKGNHMVGVSAIGGMPKSSKLSPNRPKWLPSRRSIAREPHNKADLAYHLFQWKKWADLAPDAPDEHEQTGEPEIDIVNGARRITTPMRITKTPGQIITFPASVATLYPGAIVQSRDAITNGLLTSAGIVARERATLRVAISALGSGQSVQVENPDYGKVLDAIKGAVFNKTGVSELLDFKHTSAHTSSETTLKLGLSPNSLGFSAKLNIEGSLKEKQNTVVVYLYERAFTASCVVEDADELINDDFTEERMTRLVTFGNMGHENPPVYVSDVFYGRFLIFTITSSESVGKIEAAVSASFSAFEGLNPTLKAEYQAAMNESEIRLITQGATPTILQHLIAGTIANYFKEPVKLHEYTIIGYAVSSLFPNRVARMSETAEYDRVVWEEALGLHVADAFPGLRDTEFSLGVDSAYTVKGAMPHSLAIFSRRGALAFYDLDDGRIKTGPGAIGQIWPSLRNSIFADGIDAICRYDADRGRIILFKGGKCREVSIYDGASGYTYDIASRFPGLRNTIFADGVDAASLVPGHTKDYYFFKGDKYIRYDTHSEEIIAGPEEIISAWSHLAHSAFANGVSEVCLDPQTEAYLCFFKGDRFVRYIW